jgi:hypothetical protein
VQVLTEAGAPLAGLILNLLPRVRGGYGYYDSYYDYSYHGYYEDKKNAAPKAEVVSIPPSCVAPRRMGGGEVDMDRDGPADPEGPFGYG